MVVMQSVCGFGPNAVSIDLGCSSCGHWRCYDCTTRQENVSRGSGFPTESKRTQSASFQHADDELRRSRAPKEPDTPSGNPLNIASGNQINNTGPNSWRGISTIVSGEADTVRVPLRAITTLISRD